MQLETARLLGQGDGRVRPAGSGALKNGATGMTPLMLAVKDNRTSFVERLIDLGSDVGARNNDNYNVLHISAMYSREDVVKLLLTKRGVDPFSTGGSRQQTAVHLVASRQTGTATSILRALLTAAGKDTRLRADGTPTKNGYYANSFQKKLSIIQKTVAVLRLGRDAVDARVQRSPPPARPRRAWHRRPFQELTRTRDITGAVCRPLAPRTAGRLYRNPLNETRKSFHTDDVKNPSRRAESADKAASYLRRGGIESS
ncbi:KN motif and ankyrin repeat domain-containing protein 3 [Eumeta japonica]|uniref:KN motif and ankyrin repeat domain-containing protein 3 n=1 Tax=Eumeta variegata TaxID=151549 RepID=A0A4C1S7M5_EUMVA|nr:KN motif and ankyrin repeat domain-containing protein 3 [Eumeta japonica]